MTRLGKLTPILTVLMALMLLIGGLVIASYGERSYRAEKANGIGAQARILASTVTAALSFHDRNAAQEYVKALRANSEIEAVAVYDADDSLFASFARSDDAKFPDRAPAGPEADQDGRLTVTAPSTAGGAVLGSVHIRTQIEPLTRTLIRYSLFALLGIMAAVIVTVLGIAQTALRRANSDLAAANKSLETQIAEREKAEAALRQAQKMEAIGQLTGGVAHDFNNLLHGMMASLDAVRRRIERAGIPEEAAQGIWKFMDMAVQSAERGASLTHRLLAFARRQPLAPKSTDANQLVAGMSELLRRALGEGVAVETVLAGGLWRISVDGNQLENALLNLAVNARDAMPEGGKLTIETANAHLDETYEQTHEDVKAGQYVLIAVTDTGMGMTEDVIAKAFDPFFTTKDIGKGTGLGLSQVYGFVKQSGGHVKIYSEVGYGTTVKIYLSRLVSAEVEASQPKGVRQGPAGARGEIILVVEDDPQVRASNVEMIRELGYGVIHAPDVPSALKILEDESTISLLFTDVGLPGGLTGRHLADEARRRWPALKVLYTTGYARNAIVHQGRLDQGVLLIEKPFTPAALAKKIRQALDGRAD